MNKYFSFDNGFLQGLQCTNMKIVLNPLHKENEVYFTEDKSWEPRFDNSYPNVLYDKKEKIYRIYYTSFLYDAESSNTPLSERVGKNYMPTATRICGLLYAQSTDGINWEKPELNLVEWNGSKANNIIMRDCHGGGVFIDEEELDPAKRYKLITKIDHSHSLRYMACAFSADGIHFTDPIKWTVHDPAADTHNFAFRDKRDGKFKLITREWLNGLRIVSLCESTDFLNWSMPVELTRGEGVGQQIYSMPVYQDGNLYMGLASMYHDGDRNDVDFDTVDVSLRYSSRLSGFEKVSDEYFIPRSRAPYPQKPDGGCVYSSVPIRQDGKLYFYYMGGNGQHTNYREGSLMRGYINEDEYASWQVKDGTSEAVITTTGLNFYGENLKILADVDNPSDISVELIKIDREYRFGEVIEDFKVSLSGEGRLYNIKFPQEIFTLKNQVCHMRFRMKSGKIYAVYGDFEVLQQRY